MLSQVILYELGCLWLLRKRNDFNSVLKCSMDVLFLMCDGSWSHNLGAVTLNALQPYDVRLENIWPFSKQYYSKEKNIYFISLNCFFNNNTVIIIIKQVLEHMNVSTNYLFSVKLHMAAILNIRIMHESDIAPVELPQKSIFITYI